MKFFFLLFICVILTSCSLKSKEELHMERGLSLLNNVKEINDSFNGSLKVKQLGFVKRKESKVLIISLDSFPSASEPMFFDSVKLKLQLSFKNGSDNYVKTFEVIPIMNFIKSNSYLTGEIKFAEKKIDKMTMFFIDKENKNIVSNKILVKNIYTNND